MPAVAYMMTIGFKGEGDGEGESEEDGGMVRDPDAIDRSVGPFSTLAFFCLLS